MNATDTYKALNQGFKHVLPSGVEVTLRALNLRSYIRAGRIPTHLQALVETVNAHGIGPAVAENEAGMTEYFEWIISEALVDPRVTTDPDAAAGDVLYIDALPAIDQLEIVRLAYLNISQAVEALRPLSKAKAAKSSASSTPAPDATAAAPAPLST